MNCPVYHIATKWSESIMTDPRNGEILCVVKPSYRGNLSATLRFPSTKDGKEVQIPIGFDCWVGNESKKDEEGGNVWGLIRLGPGVWQVTPSLVLAEYNFHAYVVLCDVPEPAPFL